MQGARDRVSTYSPLVFRQICLESYSQRHIIQCNVEARRSSGQVVANQSRDVLSLGDQLAGVELGHHALQHLVDDGRQHPLVKVRTQSPVDLRKGVDPRSGQDTAGDVHHLQVLGAGQRRNVAGLRANVIDDGSFNPGDPKMRSYKSVSLANRLTTRVGIPSLYISFFTPLILEYLMAR